ncbi:MAG TPA: hypothetical protein PKY59_05895 [Pyrinomonadaceae bacterium]|nr:hypothetical protein [Pyrinomonadaceae bacterium]
MKDENQDDSINTENEKKSRDLKKRLKQYALRIIKLYEALPKKGAVHIITHQLVRSGTSPGAQNRMRILSVNAKAFFKNWKKVCIGWIYSSKANLSLKTNSNRFAMKRTNLFRSSSQWL